MRLLCYPLPVFWSFCHTEKPDYDQVYWEVWPLVCSMEAILRGLDLLLAFSQITACITWDYT